MNDAKKPDEDLAADKQGQKPVEKADDKKSPWSLLEIIKQGAIMALLVFVGSMGMNYMQRPALHSGVVPDITGVLLDGREVKLSDYRGKPVIVHFWATWCGACKREAPTINALSKEYAMITVAGGQSGTDLDVKKHLVNYELDFPALNDRDNHFTDAFGVKAFPTTYILNGKGEVAFTEVGFTSEIGFKLRLWWAGRD